MKVFLDNNLSPYLAHALHTRLEPGGDRVIHLADRFAPDTEDRIWIETLAARRLGHHLRRPAHQP